MWFFKKKKENIHEEINPLKQKIYDDARRKMELNYLSQKQIEKVIANNQDVDFLDDEMKNELNYPDLEFLAKKLMPQNLKENNIRKNINDIDIVKAVCLGDIIGSRYEFTEHNYILSKTEELPPPQSHYTDDTVLSIATMKAIKENKTRPDFRKHYIEAYKQYPMAGYGSTFVGWALGTDIDNTKGYNSFGNGCAMRVSCIPAYYENIEDVIKHTISATMTTHNHIESIKGSVVIAVCIWMALHNYTKEDIYNYCKKHYLYSEKEQSLLVQQWSHFDLNTDLNSLSNEQSKTSLFVNYAVPFAIKCFYQTNSYEECMREILSHFGDTDTICAIAGGLCYAYHENIEFNTDIILKQYNVVEIINV